MKKFICYVLVGIVFMTILGQPAMAASKYKDVDTTDTFYNDVVKMCNLGAISTTNGMFKPGTPITVEQFLKLILVATGSKLTEPKNNWSTPYINAAISKGLIYKGEFKTYTKNITRAEAAYIISNSMKETYAINLSDYKAKIKDYNKIPASFKDAVLKCYTKGIFTLAAYNFNPTGTLKRSDACTIMTKLLLKDKRNYIGNDLISPDIKVVINNKTLNFASDMKPLYDFNGDIQVPIYPFAKLIGATYKYLVDGNGYPVYWVEKNDKYFKTSGEYQYDANGSVKTLITKIKNWRTCTWPSMSLKAMVDALGATYFNLETKTNTITINMPDDNGQIKISKGPSDYYNSSIPQRLYKLSADGSEKDILKAHYNLVQDLGESGDSECEKTAQFAKSYIETMNNINYLNVPSDYKNKLMNFFGSSDTWTYNGKRNLNTSDYVDAYINDFKMNKIVEESYFVTDPSLVYQGSSLGRVRGTLYFKFGQSSNKAWLWPGSVVEKWYQMDMEIECGYDPHSNGNLTVTREIYLSKAKLKED